MNTPYDSEYEDDHRRDVDQRERQSNPVHDRDFNRRYERPGFTGRQNWPGNQEDARSVRERLSGGRSSGYGGEQSDNRIANYTDNRIANFNKDEQRGGRFERDDEYRMDRSPRGYPDERQRSYETRSDESTSGFRDRGARFADYRQGSQGYNNPETTLQDSSQNAVSQHHFATQQQAGRHTGRGPRNYQRSDERIHEEINDRLTSHPEIDATEMIVSVQSGEVTLSGTVEERYAKRMAEDLAESVSGVKEVHNQIRVNRTAGQRTYNPQNVGQYESQAGARAGVQTAGSLLGSHSGQQASSGSDLSSTSPRKTETSK